MQEMKRKEYEQPKTDVVELCVTCQLLAGSVTATMDGTFTEEDI